MITNQSHINSNLTSITAAKNDRLIGSSGLKSEVGVFIATVVDAIFNENHPYFKTAKKIDSSNTPVNYKDEAAKSNDIDYSYVGRIKIRKLDDSSVSLDKLPWALPLNRDISQIPLLNENVLVYEINGTFYYANVLSSRNFINNNADFGQNLKLSFSQNQKQIRSDKHESYLSDPRNIKNSNKGYLGDYFIINKNIRSVKKYEGDTVIESRNGQSIRMSTYDNSRFNDKGFYPSYALDNNLFPDSSDGGNGNPMIVIRNRQRNLAQDAPQLIHPKLPPIPVVPNIEKNYGGQIEEDINHDGSSIYITSGYTVSSWKTTVYKSIFGNTEKGEPTEEQTKFNPPGSTGFRFPILAGDQVVLNTDRLILSSRFAETFHFSKKRYSVVTDNEYTVDANDKIVLTTNNSTCINSPQIFLGQYGETNEPALLGQTTVDWLYDLCNWLLDHVHWYHHVHPHPHGHEDAGKINAENTNDAVPDQTQIPVQQIKLRLLRDNLHKNLSRRVFLTGGGYAPGSNGVKPPGSGGECKDPVEINTVTGEGVVGDFKGRNRREGPVQIEFELEN